MSVFAGPKKGKPVRKDQGPLKDETPLGAKIASVKAVLEHFGLYIGLACYTALGAKVFQMCEYPHEIDKLETNLALLNTSRILFLQNIGNVSNEEEDYKIK